MKKQAIFPLNPIYIYAWMTLICLCERRFYCALLKETKERIAKWRGIKPARLPYYRWVEDAGDTAPEPALDIDLVFTWVDGLSAQQKELRQQWGKQLGLDNVDTANAKRYSDNGELKLALRSVEKHLPWVRKIFIVTAGEVPEWLDVNHPKIQMVTHKEIFPDAACLPTFNSRAIECQLNHIPGLSEHFIYCNDDMFFGKPCHKRDFFMPDGQGGYKAAMQRSFYIIPAYFHYKRGQYWRRGWNNLRVLLRRGPIRYRADYHLSHQATPLKKSFFAEVQETYPQLYKAVSASRFRNAYSIPPIGLASYIGLWRNEAQLRPISEVLMHTADDLRYYFTEKKPVKLCCVNSVNSKHDVNDVLAESIFAIPCALEKK